MNATQKPPDMVRTMQPKRRGGAPRRLTFRFGLTAFAVSAGLWGWGEWEERSLARRVEALRQAGEPVTTEELRSTPVPEHDNAAFAFRAAARTVDGKSDAWIAGQPLIEDLRLPLRPNERAALRALVADNAKGLAGTVNAARMRGSNWEADFEFPISPAVMAELREQRKLVELLIADALLAVDAGDALRAVQRVGELLAHSRAMDHHPSLIGHLVAGGSSMKAADVAGELACSPGMRGAHRPAVRKQIDALITRFLEEQEFRDGLIRSFRSERVGQFDAFEAVAAGEVSLVDLLGLGRERIPGDLAVQRALRGWVLRNGSVALDYMNDVLAAAEESTTQAAFLARRAVARSHPLERSPRFYFAANLMVPSVDRVGRAHFRILAARRMAAAALAVALYRADHDGQLPATLADLVPKYLPAVPTDPIAAGAKPLGYVADPARPRLYSIGDDGVDDGGLDLDHTMPTPQNGPRGDFVVDLNRRPREDAEAAGKP